MKISYRSYPHPVLAYFSDDLVRCAFQATVMFDQTINLYRLSITGVLSNAELKSMIENGLAAFAVHVECSSTRYRRIWTSRNNAFTIEVPCYCVEGNVDVCIFVVALDSVDDYRNEKFHEDYEGRSFRVNKGDVLAVAEDRHFLAENRRDLLRNIPSIFTVSRATAPDSDSIDYELLGDKITIKLRSEIYDQYIGLSQAPHLYALLLSVAVVPVLTEVINEIFRSADPDSEFGDKRWYRVLRRRMAEIGFNADEGDPGVSSVVIAQRLLENRLEKAVSTIEELSMEGE